MRGYTQLTQEQRYQIYILKQAEYNQAQIAEMLERDKSTISRELRRNREHSNWTSQWGRVTHSHRTALCSSPPLIV